MKYLIIFALLTCSVVAFGQAIPVLKPNIGALINKSPEGEREHIKARDKCVALWQENGASPNMEKLSEEERLLWEFCNAEEEEYYSILGVGCSWYCGGGQDTLTASSALKASGQNTYAAKNAHDLSYKTAWIEGAPGDGIGEYLVYHMPPQTPRITKVIIVNGYVKSEKSWRENSRVKTLRMYKDGKPFALLELQDSRHEQIFTVEPLGYSDREDWTKLGAMPWWSLKFEIMAVYKGDKYDDTAITQIYFDGIDVH